MNFPKHTVLPSGHEVWTIDVPEGGFETAVLFEGAVLNAIKSPDIYHAQLVHLKLVNEVKAEVEQP